jgi:hypothetical protein
MATSHYFGNYSNKGEQRLIEDIIVESIKIMGTDCYYLPNDNDQARDILYGEDPDAGFSVFQEMTVLLNLTNDSYLLSKFGIIADSDLTGVIHPKHYTTVFGVSAEPKAGDLMLLQEFGIDRINYPKRGPTVYELTEVIDEFQLNALGGHYVWFFKAKRYDYSFEDGSPGSGIGNVANNDNDALEQLADSNFNYEEENPCSNTGVYGDY